MLFKQKILNQLELFSSGMLHASKTFHSIKDEVDKVVNLSVRERRNVLDKKLLNKNTGFEILRFQMAVGQKLCIFYPNLVKPKCISGVAVFFKMGVK